MELEDGIAINIINFNLFDCEGYHLCFEVRECERNELPTVKLAMHLIRCYVIPLQIQKSFW